MTAGSNLSVCSIPLHTIFVSLSLKSFVLCCYTNLYSFHEQKLQVYIRPKCKVIIFSCVYHTINRKGCISCCELCELYAGITTATCFLIGLSHRETSRRHISASSELVEDFSGCTLNLVQTFTAMFQNVKRSFEHLQPPMMTSTVAPRSPSMGHGL